VVHHPEKKDKQGVPKRSTKCALSLHRTAKSTSPKGMLHALFPANAAGPACSWDRASRLSLCLRGPWRKASAALQGKSLIDQCACPTHPRGPQASHWLSCLLDWGRSRLGQDIDGADLPLAAHQMPGNQLNLMHKDLWTQKVCHPGL